MVKKTIRQGEIIHYSAGALIQKENRYLLINRFKPPFGFAGLAGHVEENETFEEAVKREVNEESDLLVTEIKFLIEGETSFGEHCTKGARKHIWKVFECKTKGKIKINKKEVKSYDWYTPKEIKELKLEHAWEYWFKQLKII